MECPDCNGSGEIEIICKACHGTGWVGGIPGGTLCCGGYDTAECPTCGGSGEIEDEDYYRQEIR